MHKVTESEMKSEWQSWEHLFIDDLRRIEHRIQSCYSQMATVGVPREARERYVTGKLVELIKRVSEEAA